MKSLILSFFYTFLIQLVNASNWAQVSGPLKQNVVLTQHPAPAHPHWGPRFGMAVVRFASGPTPDVGEIFLVGGDTYDEKFTLEEQNNGFIDSKNAHGYKNDVWKTVGTDWAGWTVRSDIRETNNVKVYIRYPSGKYKRQRMPRVYSELHWDQVEAGRNPPPGITHDQWISCILLKSANGNKKYEELVSQAGYDCNQDNFVNSRQWAPRRHHGLIQFKETAFSPNDAACSVQNWIFVLGGRAREFVDLPENKSIGGILGGISGVRIKNIYNSQADLGITAPEYEKASERTARETIIVKSDVWKSPNGYEWELVTPGCRSNQEDLIANAGKNGGRGRADLKCTDTNDCYGNEDCIDETCTCVMWSPREQHTVGSFKGYMYVVGGYASRLYNDRSACGNFACGDVDASGYRHYLSDVWQSVNGKAWFQVKPDGLSGLPGRGGHAMILAPDRTFVNYLWIFGGRGGYNEADGLLSTDLIYYNDIWRFRVSVPQILTVSDDKLVRKYDSTFIETGNNGQLRPKGEILDTDTEHSTEVQDAVFSSDERYFLSVDAAGTVIMRRYDTFETFWTGNFGDSGIKSAISSTLLSNAATDTSQEVFIVSNGNKAKIYNFTDTEFPNDVYSDALVLSLNHDAVINSIDSLECDTLIATGGSDGLIKIWDLAYKGTRLPVSLNAGGDAVLSVAFAPYSEGLDSSSDPVALNNYLVSGHTLGIAVIWEQIQNAEGSTTWHKLATLEHGGSPVTSVTYSPPGLSMYYAVNGRRVTSMILTGSGNKPRLFDTTDPGVPDYFGSLLFEFKHPNSTFAITSVAFSPDESQLIVVTGDKDGRILLWSGDGINAGKLLVTLTSTATKHGSSINFISYGPSSGALQSSQFWIDYSSSIATYDPSCQSETWWCPRTGHTISLDLANRVIVLVGGETEQGVFSDEVWTWWLDRTNDPWRKDYTFDSYFSTASEDASGIIWNLGSPAIHYVNIDDDLSYLKRFILPDKATTMPPYPEGKRPEEKFTYMTDKRIKQLNSLGIRTIKDLAEADKYQILKARGYDVHGTPSNQLLDYYDVCDTRLLCEAIVDMCTVTDRKFYAGELQMPWNVKNEFGGKAPVKPTLNDDEAADDVPGVPQKWHNRDFTDYQVIVDYDELVASWDGCKRLRLPYVNGEFAFKKKPNVDGVGFVPFVDNIVDPLNTLQELQCKINPRKRAYHAALQYESRTYIFGGKSTEQEFNGDTWYRDDRLPSANCTKIPSSESDEHIFAFGCDEAGCSYEYRLWDPYNYKQLLEWTPVVYKADISWLDWRMGGPGDGEYIFFVRAVDPAGNRDEKFVLGRNMILWTYYSPIPWDIIMQGVGGFLGLCLFGYLEYRRRMKKAAMERYAMKRMRRKFKAMQRDQEGGAVDWRTLYAESKQQDTAKKKTKKQERDEKKRAREKDKKKKEKEKEAIKKKLKAGKEHKDKQKRAMEEEKEKKANKAEGGSKRSKKIKKLKDKSDTSDGGEFTMKLKDYEKVDAQKKFKDYETDGSPKKFKDYEMKDITFDPKAPKGDPSKETGTKQRKAYTKYQDEEGNRDTSKKDI